MSGTTMSEDISSTTGSDVNNQLYLTEENQHSSTSLLETKELTILYTANADSKTMSTSPENVSSIDAERSTSEAMDITDSTEPKRSNVSQPDTSTGHENTESNDIPATPKDIGENITSVNKLKDNTDDNSASGANEEVSLPLVDASDLEDIDKAPTTDTKHSDTMGSLDDTVNPDRGDVDISDDIDIEAYAVAYENMNGILDKTSDDTDTHDAQDPHKRVLPNPMYEADVHVPQQAADNSSDEHELEDPSKSHQPAADDSKNDKNLRKLQSQPQIKPQQPNLMYRPCIPNPWTGDNSPIYRYVWLIAFIAFLVMVALIATGILVGVKHSTQDPDNTTVTPLHLQGSRNWSTTSIVMPEPDSTQQLILGSMNSTNQTVLGGTYGLGTQQTDTGTIVTFGGYGKVWKKQKNYGKFDHVSGLAASSTDEIFVCDYRNKRIQVFSMKGVFLRSFDTNMKPQAIAMDQDDTLWVLLTGIRYKGLRKIYIRNVNRYNREGHVLARTGCTLRQEVNRIALDTLSDNIVITTYKGKDVKAGWFKKDLCTVQPFRRTELMWLKWPSSVTIDKKGNIFITDLENNLVLKYDKNGTYICCFGRKGDGGGNHLKSPSGICMDSSGHIIVADNGNNRVEMFTAEGEYIRTVANISRPRFVAIGREGQLIVTSLNRYVTIFPKY